MLLNGKGAGPAKFERDANCVQEARGTKGEGEGTRSRSPPSIKDGAAWDLGHRQECLCYWKATASVDHLVRMVLKAHFCL